MEDGGQESGGDSTPTAATAGVTANLTVGSSPTPKPGTLRPLKRNLIDRLRTVPRGGRLIYNLMSNAKTGLWSAVGALLGGVAGAFAGKAAVQYMPRKYYGARRGVDVADAMATGAAGRRGRWGVRRRDDGGRGARAAGAVAAQVMGPIVPVLIGCWCLSGMIPLVIERDRIRKCRLPQHRCK